jgi:hypothetical protein
MDDKIKRLADMLQGWERGQQTIGFREVLSWERSPGHVGLALRGDALKLERHAETGMIPNRHYQLDASLQRAFGLDAQTEYERMRPVGVRGGLGQLLDTDDAHISDVMDAIQQCANEASGLTTHATIMPAEGSPWNPGTDETEFYNARTGKISKTSKPDWLIEVNTKDGVLLGADFCKLVPRLRNTGGGHASMRLCGLDLLVTHSFSPAEARANYVRDCGGLLFPSLAVGEIPAAIFGTVVLVLDPMVVLQGMKPYRSGRRRWPIVTYSTDVWTETMHDFLGEAAHELYAQLTGQWAVSLYGRTHQYILGPPVQSEGGPAGGRVLGDTKGLGIVLARRSRIWTRDLVSVEATSAEQGQREGYYPFVEAKANVVVEVPCVVACAFPSYLSASVRAYLKRIGFTGELLPIKGQDREALESYANRDAVYRYSWAVHDAVVALNRSLEVRQ